MPTPQNLDELTSLGVTWLAVWIVAVIATAVVVPASVMVSHVGGVHRRRLVALILGGLAAIGWAVFFFQTGVTLRGGGHCVIRDQVQTHLPFSFHPLGDCHDAQFVKGLLSVWPMAFVTGAAIVIATRSRLRSAP